MNQLGDNFVSNIMGYLETLDNLPDHIKDQIPEIYGYIWAKCSLMNQLGFEKYAKDDYFHYPLKKVWLSDDFKQSINQIVYDLNGITPDNPIDINCIETIYQILYSLHFKLNTITDSENVIQVDAVHLVNDDTITLYFKQKNYKIL